MLLLAVVTEFRFRQPHPQIYFDVTYEPAAGNWQASLFGYNITDERIIAGGCGEGRGGSIAYSLEAPSQWGAEFTMRFGGA